MRRRLPLLLAVFCAIAVAIGTFSCIPLRMDMRAFLPRPHDDTSQFLLDELNNGTTQSLMLASIKGDDEATLLNIGHRFHDALVAGGQFNLILDGPSALSWQKDQPLLFAHRYGLAPHDHTRLFTPTALRTDLNQLYDLLQSMAAPVVEDVGLHDPTGAYGDYLASLNEVNPPQSKDGLWLTTDHHATLMLLHLRHPSLDTAQLTQLHHTIMQAFAQSVDGHKGYTLTLTGTPAFSFFAAQSLRHDMDRLALLSLSLVIIILYWRFRSLWVLAAIGVPFLLSLSLAMLGLHLLFGWVHGIALGFGMTMLGVSLDYPVLLLGHRDKGEAIPIVLGRIGTSLKLAALTAIIGLLSMIFCGLPGLMQLGLFSAIGILTAACLTIWVLPHLITQADLAAYHQGISRSLLRWEKLRHYRMLCLLAAPLALALLWLHPFQIERQGQILNPIPPSMLETDRQLRQQLGAPQAGLLGVIHAADSETVLQREEAILERLPPSHDIEAAALLLPSKARQQHRVESLPPEKLITANLHTALQGSPFSADAFATIPRDVASAQQQPSLGIEDLTNTTLAYRLALLLFPRHGSWYGLLIPRTPEAAEWLRRDAQHDPTILLVNMRTAVGDLLHPYVQQAALWLIIGTAFALITLFFCLKSPGRVGRVALTLTLTGLSTLALLRLHHPVFSIIHIVALAFVLGVNIDYALFFGRPQLDEAERTRTLRTLLTCNLMTVSSFAILASCQTPLLREIGLTISCGALLALIFSFLLMGAMPPKASMRAKL
ncbi:MULTISPECIES: MMPL family transporter [Bombella]|uniref:MMPL family transporter n=1 Tax=Bombella pollinis TaxID=2967337 RepID=A0ABT3WMY1_9PROT|nr:MULTISPECIES: MMPL family transporter [Bombella]MCX5619003.1 MMPL family transporter [Bombella pollinis]MUG89474.1 MMPL family transporter [Bombella sp. ESL0385]